MFAFFSNLGMTEQLILLVFFGVWFGCAFAGSYVSRTKNRSAIEGFLFGLFLGPIGILIAAVLPTKGFAK